jgi:hypothetical protein
VRGDVLHQPRIHGPFRVRVRQAGLSARHVTCTCRRQLPDPEHDLRR